MVVSNFPEKGQRGREASAAARRGLTKEEFDTWNVPMIDRISAKQFEHWLVQKFGPEYLEPVTIYFFKDGAGI